MAGRVEVEVYCYGFHDEYCKLAYLELSKLRTDLILDHQVDIKVSIVDYSSAPLNFHSNYHKVADLLKEVARVKIGNKYIFSYKDLVNMREQVMQYILRCANEDYGGLLGMSGVGVTEAI